MRHIHGLTPAATIKTSLVSGASGAGKTVLAGTYPRVAWIGSTTEGGKVALDYMDETLFYERGIRPEIYTVSSIPEVRQHLDKDILPGVRTGRIRTIALELTFYTDDVVRSLKGGEGKNDGFAVYGTLEEHVKLLDREMKQFPHLHIHYNAIAAPAVSDKTPGGIIIAGKALPNKLPAVCDLTGYLRQEEVTADGKTRTDRVLHLSAYGSWTPRHRYGNKLPPFVRNPTFRKLENLLKGIQIVDEAGNVIDRPPVQVQVPASLPPLQVPTTLPPLQSTASPTQPSAGLPPLPKTQP